MKLIKHDNFFNDPFAEMDRWFDRALGGNRWSFFNDTYAQPATRQFRVDIYDDGDAYQVVAEVPGVDKKDLDIQLENAVLTVTAERKVKDGEQEHTYKASRSVTLGDDIDAEKVTAKLEDGLLTISLPKAEARKPKAITVS